MASFLKWTPFFGFVARSLLLLAFSVHCVDSVYAQDEVVALIKSIVVDGQSVLEAEEGEVRVFRGRDGTEERGKTGLSLMTKDEVRTGPRTQVILLFLDSPAEKNNTLLVDANSRIELTRSNAFFLFLGRILAQVRGVFDLATRSVTLGAAGTEFEVVVDGHGNSRLDVLDGTVEVRRSEAQLHGQLPLEKIFPQALLGFRSFLALPAEQEVNDRTGFQVGRLHWLEMKSQAPAVRPKPMTMRNLQQALRWSSELMLSAQPTHGPTGSLSYFSSIAARSNALRESRFKAIWREDSESQIALGNVYCDWGEGAKGLEAYEKALTKQRPKGEGSRNLGLLAEAHRLMGQFNKAEELLEEAVKRDRPWKKAYNIMANVQLAKGRIALAKGDLSQSRQRLKLATEYYEELLGPSLLGGLKDADRSVVRANQGEVLLLMGRLAVEEKNPREAAHQYELAVGTFAKAGREDPASPIPVLGLAKTHYAVGQLALRHQNLQAARTALAEAQRLSHRALNLDSGLAPAYLLLGELAETDGGAESREKAIGYYEQAIQLSPASPDGYHRLGLLLAKEDPQRASLLLKVYQELQLKAFQVGQKGVLGTGVVAQTAKPVEVWVPGLRAQPENTVRHALAHPELRLGKVERGLSRGLTQGTVSIQDLPAKRKFSSESGTTKERAASRVVRVPSVVGQQRQRAELLLSKAGLRTGQVTFEETQERKEGIVLRQSPQANQEVETGTSVHLVVARYVPPAETRVMVPDVSERFYEEAARILSNLGLRAAREGRGNYVARQYPAAGTSVVHGSEVTLYLVETVK